MDVIFLGILAGILVLVVLFTLLLIYLLHVVHNAQALQQNEHRFSYLNKLIMSNVQRRSGASTSARHISQIFHHLIRSPNDSANRGPDLSNGNGDIPSLEFRPSPPQPGKNDRPHPTQVSFPPVLTPKVVLSSRDQRDRFKHEDPYDYPPSPRPIASAVAASGKDVSQTVHETDTASFADPAESVAENQEIFDDPENSSGGESSHGQSPELSSERAEKGCPLTKEGCETRDRPPGCTTMKGQQSFAPPIFTSAIKEMKMLTLFKQRKQWEDPAEPKDTTGTSDLSLEEEQEPEQEKASPNSVIRKAQESPACPQDIANEEKKSLPAKKVMGKDSPSDEEHTNYTDSKETKEEEDETGKRGHEAGRITL
ncbi:uncharacterized protein [Penaeus vannamei]|uniref:uncharacterized protein n=1 Tax=Penaeus vannamei TaxID=6689 RepID=UPI00387FA9CE